jgi:hypothetical protein
MAITAIITNENAVNRAELLQTTLQYAKVRLLQSYQPQYTDNRTVLEANECNFTGYPAGGYNSTNWAGPTLPPGGGAAIAAPIVNVAPTSGNVISNNVTGYWVENTVGNVTSTYITAAINPGISVLNPTDQFPLFIQDWEGLVAAPSFG